MGLHSVKSLRCENNQQYTCNRQCGRLLHCGQHLCKGICHLPFGLNVSWHSIDKALNTVFGATFHSANEADTSTSQYNIHNFKTICHKDSNPSSTSASSIVESLVADENKLQHDYSTDCEYPQTLEGDMTEVSLFSPYDTCEYGIRRSKNCVNADGILESQHPSNDSDNIDHLASISVSTSFSSGDVDTVFHLIRQGCGQCRHSCSQPRPTGCVHKCSKGLCHAGSCPPCSEKLKISCHCGKNSTSYPCSDWTSLSPNQQHSQRACPARCTRRMSCGHRCVLTCHNGSCSTPSACTKSVRIRCPCRLHKEVRGLLFLKGGGEAQTVL